MNDLSTILEHPVTCHVGSVFSFLRSFVNVRLKTFVRLKRMLLDINFFFLSPFSRKHFQVSVPKIKSKTYFHGLSPVFFFCKNNNSGHCGGPSMCQTLGEGLC